MRFKYYYLPDEDPFLSPVRQIVETIFKIFGWMILTGTIQYAAEATKSILLYILVGIAYILLLFYLQSLGEWLLKIKLYFRSREYSLPDPSGSWWRRALTWAVWTPLVIGIQNWLANTIDILVSFHRMSGK